MAGKALELGGPIRVADYLSLGLLARLVPPSLVDQALTEHGKHSQRQRDLPAHAVAYYVMALSLYRGINTEEVLRVVTEGMEYLGANAIRREVGKSAISAARTRLGAEVMQSIARQALVPLATPATPGAFYHGLRLVSLDGSGVEVADEAVNRETFGVPGTQQGRTGYPQVRFVGLLENGTHVLFGVALGGYQDAEVSLAHQAIAHLQPGMLCLADRGLSGYPLWAAASRTGAQLLWRVAKNRTLPVRQRLDDRDHLCRDEDHPQGGRCHLAQQDAGAGAPGVLGVAAGPSRGTQVDVGGGAGAGATAGQTELQTRACPHAPQTPRQRRPSPQSCSRGGGINCWSLRRQAPSRVHGDDPIRAWSSAEPSNTCRARATNRSICVMTGRRKSQSEQHWVWP